MPRRKKDDEPRRFVRYKGDKPSCHEGEVAILGAVLLDNMALAQAQGAQISPDYFDNYANRKLFTYMLELESAGSAIDLITLSKKAEEYPNGVAGIGGVAYISSLTDGLPHRPSIDRYVDMLRDAYRRRRLLALADVAAARALDPSCDAMWTMGELGHDVLDVQAHGATEGFQHVMQFSNEIWDETLRLAERHPEAATIGLRTGLSELDILTTGFRDGEYYIVGGWAKDGKTSLLIQSVLANLTDDVNVGVFSQEMTRQQFILRMLPQLSKGLIEAREMRDPRKMNLSTLQLFKELQKEVNGLPLWVDQTSQLDIHELIARARLLIKREKARIIYVDYIQLARASGLDDPTQIVGAISSGLRNLAKNEGVPVVALSQLTRPEGKRKRRPTMFDLKQSGQLEQDAHAVIFAYRPQKGNGEFTGKDEIIIGAQREGPCEAIPVEYNTRLLAFGGREPDENSGEDDKEEKF